MAENRLDGTLNFGRFGLDAGKPNCPTVFRRPLLTRFGEGWNVDCVSVERLPEGLPGADGRRAAGHTRELREQFS